MSAAATPPPGSPPPSVAPKPGAITPALALERILAAATPLPAEPVAITSAAGRVLADEACAVLSLPLETNSAMDGFAVRAADGPWTAAPIVGESRAGHPFASELPAGAVIRIATGAPLPAGADAVVPVELAEESAAGVALPAAERGRHVRYAGEDVGAGDVLARAGKRLAPHQLVVLAGAGVAELACHRRPRVAVVVTGDELVAAGAVPQPGQVVDVHSVALPALIEAAGAQVSDVVSGVADDPAAVQAALAGLGRCDVVLVTGGLSVGRHDHTRGALASLGVELIVERLLMRPGQPTAVGISEHDGAPRLWFGLPGNPVSAYVVATLLLLPALRRLEGAPEPDALPLKLPLAAAATPDARRWLALRATLTGTEGGREAVVLAGQASHMMGALAASQALALLPPGDEPVPADTLVSVELLPGASR